MPILSEKDRGVLAEKFGDLKDDVNMVFFTQKESKLLIPGQECQTCQETHQILDELTALSDKLHLETYDLVGNAEKARELGVDRIPAIVLDGAAGNSIRFFGIPAGYEFASLVDSLIHVSQGESGLSQETKEALKAIDKQIHIQVFVTPT